MKDQCQNCALDERKWYQVVINSNATLSKCVDHMNLRTVKAIEYFTDALGNKRCNAVTFAGAEQEMHEEVPQ